MVRCAVVAGEPSYGRGALRRFLIEIGTPRAGFAYGSGPAGVSFFVGDTGDDGKASRTEPSAYVPCIQGGGYGAWSSM